MDPFRVKFDPGVLREKKGTPSTGMKMMKCNGRMSMDDFGYKIIVLTGADSQDMSITSTVELISGGGGGIVL